MLRLQKRPARSAFDNSDQIIDISIKISDAPLLRHNERGLRSPPGKAQALPARRHLLPLVVMAALRGGKLYLFGFQDWTGRVKPTAVRHSLCLKGCTAH